MAGEVVESYTIARKPGPLSIFNTLCMQQSNSPEFTLAAQYTESMGQLNIVDEKNVNRQTGCRIPMRKVLSISAKVFYIRGQELSKEMKC